MTANSARKDGNKKKARQELSNEQREILYDRLQGVIERIEHGAISFDVAAQALQRIAEKTFIFHHEGGPRKSWEIFHRPPEKERKLSLAPYGMALQKSKDRLNFPQRTPELIMCEVWEAENIPKRWINSGLVPVNTILNAIEVDSRDVRVIGSTMQWLGTNVGISFYGQFMRASELRGI